MYNNFFKWPYLTRTGNYLIHELDWLKLLLTPVEIQRLVTFNGERVAN